VLDGMFDKLHHQFPKVRIQPVPRKYMNEIKGRLLHTHIHNLSVVLIPTCPPIYSLGAFAGSFLATEMDFGRKIC